jgi:hypothetical protein
VHDVTGGLINTRFSLADYLNMKRNVILLLILAAFFFACTEKKFVSSGVKLLTFSLDTVYFDTVFTGLGSATRELRVTNPNPGWIRIDNISLAGQDSGFRLNIDGSPGNSKSDIDLAPGDSLFIFIDALVDPTNLDNPVAIYDSIVFTFHGIKQDVNILAWGQDINLISGVELSGQTWSGPKPYVVYNSMMVDTGEVLLINPGTRILFHRGSTMYVAGRLVVNGTPEEPVIFASDRTEFVYNDIPGQWSGIYFLNGSTGNIISNAVIKNSVSALHLGNLFSEDLPPDLEISNSLILHNTVSGISSLGASVTAKNCVITHCGYYSLFLVSGGSYHFLHCTVNNFWDYSSRFSPGVLVSDFYNYNDIIFTNSLDEITFTNSVISGSLGNEVEIASLSGESLNINFLGCFLKIDSTMPMWSSISFEGNHVGSDPGFINESYFDLRPDTLSPLIGLANMDSAISLGYDIRGYSRLSDSGPDSGAYERQTGEKRE